MPTRPYSIVRTAEFLGLRDDLPIEGQDAQASILRNFYRRRRKLVRRKGQAFVAEAVEMTDPLTLDDLELFLLGDEALGADGAGCASWPEISGNSGRDGAQATAGNRPINRDGASPNGLRRMVEFNAVDDLIQGALPGGPGISIVNGVTIYAYVEEQSLTTGGFNAQQLFGCGNSVSGFELLTRTSSSLGVGFPNQEYGVNSGNARAAHGATQLGFQTLVLVFEPPAGALANWRLYKDDVQLGSAGVNWQATSIHTAYEIGNAPSLNVGFEGLVGAVLLFSEAHDTETREGVSRWLVDYFEGS